MIYKSSFIIFYIGILWQLCSISFPILLIGFVVVVFNSLCCLSRKKVLILMCSRLLIFLWVLCVMFKNLILQGCFLKSFYFYFFTFILVHGMNLPVLCEKGVPFHFFHTDAQVPSVSFGKTVFDSTVCCYTSVISHMSV